MKKDIRTLTYGMVQDMFDYCESKNLSNSSFGEKLGVSKSTVGRWFNHETGTIKNHIWKLFEKISGISIPNHENGLCPKMTIIYYSSASITSVGRHTCLSCSHKSVCVRAYALAQYFKGVQVSFSCEDYIGRNKT